MIGISDFFSSFFLLEGACYQLMQVTGGKGSRKQIFSWRSLLKLGQTKTIRLC